MYTMARLVSRIILDTLQSDLVVFIWILVSWPVQTTTPITYSVLRSDIPRSRILSLPRGMIYSYSAALVINIAPYLFASIRPSNLQIKLLGPSILKVASKCVIFYSGWSNEFLKSFGTSLFFKLVSPSKFLVSTQHTPSSSVLFTHTMSAGKNPSWSTLIKSPISIYFQATFSKFLVFLLKRVAMASFSKESSPCLTQSSQASLHMDVKTTRTKGGSIVASPFEIEMTLIVYMTVIMAK